MGYMSSRRISTVRRFVGCSADRMNPGVPTRPFAPARVPSTTCWLFTGLYDFASGGGDVQKGLVFSTAPSTARFPRNRLFSHQRPKVKYRHSASVCSRIKRGARMKVAIIGALGQLATSFSALGMRRFYSIRLRRRRTVEHTPTRWCDL